MRDPWVALPRRLSEDPIAKSPAVLGGYTLLQLRCAFEPREEIIDLGRTVRILPGQILFSQRLMSEWTGWPREQVKEFMAYLSRRRLIRYPEGTQHRRPYVLELVDPWCLRFHPLTPRSARGEVTSAKPKVVKRKEFKPPKTPKNFQRKPESEEISAKDLTSEVLDTSYLVEPGSGISSQAMVGEIPKFDESPKTVSRDVENLPKPLSLADLQVDPFSATQTFSTDPKEGDGGNKKGGKGVSRSSSGVNPPPSSPPPSEQPGDFLELIIQTGLKGHRPAERRLAQGAAVIEQLLAEHGRDAIHEAVRGIQEVYPWKQGRPFDWYTLRDKFDVARAAHFQLAQREGKRRENIEFKQAKDNAQKLYERRLEVWVSRMDESIATLGDDKRRELQSLAAAQTDQRLPKAIRKNLVQVAMRQIHGRLIGEPEPQEPGQLPPKPT